MQPGGSAGKPGELSAQTFEQHARLRVAFWTDDADAEAHPTVAARERPAVAARSDIVKGFLVAMQANPINRGPARSFLSAHARPGWKPDSGTIVYESSSIRMHGPDVVVRLNDVHQLDASGVWQQRSPRVRTLTFQMVRDHARNRGRKVVDVAAAVVEGHPLLPRRRDAD